MAGLDPTIELCRALGDPTRLRLLSLLAADELTVGSLVAATGLPQPRVSTHLGKLRDAGLVRDRRQGGSRFYKATVDGPAASLLDSVDDPLLAEDRERLEAVRRGTWADQVAGQMSRHYSPGRTWESLARGLVGLIDLGDVLDVAAGDGAVAELLAPRCRQITCLDASERVVATARDRLAGVPNLRFDHGDMHELPYADASFDSVLLMAALPYARDPERVVAEVARVLRPGGRVVATCLRRHAHTAITGRFDHANAGFEPEALESLFSDVLRVDACAITSRERRPPHFEVVTLYARAL